MGKDNKSNHSALSQKMGDVYHYYIAIDYLLKIEKDKWDKCLIEKYGDIVFLDQYDNQIVNIEVKHHDKDDELKVYQVDFQKTLFNWVKDSGKYSKDTKLVLFTTSTIPETNSLYNWNNLTESEKFKLIVDNSRNSSNELYSNIKEYFGKIQSNKNLYEILAKFKIVDSSPNIKQIQNQIKSRNYFGIFQGQEEKKDKVVNSLYGLIGEGLKNKDTWEIKNNNFYQKLQESTDLLQDKILRTDSDINIDEINTKIDNYKEKIFIKKLDNIIFGDDVFQLAIDDYAKTIIEVAERMKLKTSLEYDQRLDSYEESLTRLVKEKKTEHTYKTGMTDEEKSQQCYFSIMHSTKVPFMPQEFNDQTTFFQKGYLHILADDDEKPKQICWTIKPKDLK